MTRTVLLADDDADVIATFTAWLEREGYVVRTSSDGEEALAHVDGADAVIVDARMPILDGLGFLRRLRECRVLVPVAVVTGDYLIDDVVMQEFAELGAQVLFKPLWVDELVTLATALVNCGATA